MSRKHYAIEMREPCSCESEILDDWENVIARNEDEALKIFEEYVDFSDCDDWYIAEAESSFRKILRNYDKFKEYLLKKYSEEETMEILEQWEYTLENAYCWYDNEIFKREAEEYFDVVLDYCNFTDYILKTYIFEAVELVDEEEEDSEYLLEFHGLNNVPEFNPLNL